MGLTGPGTGKTVVALHRAAYLLYSDPRLSGRRGGVLFVGPHRPYLAYVADVLPSLGDTFHEAWPLIEASELVGDLWSVPAYLHRCAPCSASRRFRAMFPDASVPTSIRSSGVPVRHGSRSELGSILDTWLAAHIDGIACVIGDVTFQPTARVQSLTRELAKASSSTS